MSQRSMVGEEKLNRQSVRYGESTEEVQCERGLGHGQGRTTYSSQSLVLMTCGGFPIEMTNVLPLSNVWVSLGLKSFHWKIKHTDQKLVAQTANQEFWQDSGWQNNYTKH